MDKVAQLDALIEAVEAGGWLDMTPAYVSLGVNATVAARAYTGSLDAALALHEALLPGWQWNCWYDGQASVHSVVADFTAHAENPARAWLLAILKAYRAQVEEL